MKKYTFFVQYPALGFRMKTYIFDFRAKSIDEAVSLWLENLNPNIFPIHFIKEIKKDAIDSFPIRMKNFINIWMDSYVSGSYRKRIDFLIVNMVVINLQELPIHKYTFISDYKSWNFLSQIEGTDPLSCLHTWVKNNTKYYPKHGMEKIQSLLNNSSFLPLQKISEGIWLFRYRFYKDYVLEIHIADTVVDQEEYPSEWD